MTDRDVLDLMRELAPVVEHRRNYGLEIEDAEVYSRTVLTSDWLATHDAQVRADERRRCVEAIEALETLRIAQVEDGMVWKRDAISAVSGPMTRRSEGRG